MRGRLALRRCFSSVSQSKQVEEPIFTKHLLYFKDDYELAIDRQERHNIVDFELFCKINQWLQNFISRPIVSGKILHGIGDFFCAGEDLEEQYEDTRKGGDLALAYLDEQFAFASAVAANPVSKFIVPLSGTAMGLGTALFSIANQRIVTEKASVHFPWVRYGAVPTMGMSYRLSRMKGNLGLFHALTGIPLLGVDIARARLATSYCHSDRILLMCEALRGYQAPPIAYDSRLNLFCEKPPLSEEFENRVLTTERLFSKSSIPEIILALEEAQEHSWIAELRKGSPRSLQLILEMITRARSLNLEQCIEMEKAVAYKVAGSADLMEGIRGVILDPSNPPNWEPELSHDELQHMFVREANSS